MDSTLKPSQIPTQMRSSGFRDYRVPTLSERILDSKSFIRAVHLEQLRSERTQRQCLLLLLNSPTLLNPKSEDKALEKILHALSNAIRVTDVIGWYLEGSTIGVLFTEIGRACTDEIPNTLIKRIYEALDVFLPDEQLSEIKVDFLLSPFDSRFVASAPQYMSLPKEVLSQNDFLRALFLERKRTERSNLSFVLLLIMIDSSSHLGGENGTVARLLRALLSNIRVTDFVGWYQPEATLGVIFTGVVDNTAFTSRTASSLCHSELNLDEACSLRLSEHPFPTQSNQDHQILYPDLRFDRRMRKRAQLAKRLMDIIGSLLAIVSLSPLALMVALAIKLTSAGPILFKQQRVGQFGKPFTFLKFRTMRVENNPHIHAEFVTHFISGHREPEASNSQAVYKLTNDRRITPLGRMLRNVALDDLPQFFNVLKGEMSLVGPRPALEYELSAYESWHKNRVYAVKPGITGLWQVYGRSRVAFDEMVRLDLRYVDQWSLWLDCKILARTPIGILTDRRIY